MVQAPALRHLGERGQFAEVKPREAGEGQKPVAARSTSSTPGAPCREEDWPELRSLLCWLVMGC